MDVKNKEQVLKIISAISFGVGLFLLLGTAGSADCGYITLEQMLIRSGVCAAMMLVPVVLGIWRGW